MSFFTEQTLVVEIDSENTVTVRKVSHGDKLAAQSAAIRFNPITQDANVDPLVIQFETLYASIVSWAGPGFENRPVSKENVRALPDEIVDRITVGVNTLNTPLSEDEKKA